MSDNTKKSGRPPMPKSQFTEVFRKLVEGYTQQQVADKIGVSRQNVGKWIQQNPTTPDIITLGKIADAYNVSTDYLLGRTNVQSTNTDLKGVCDFTNLSEDAIKQILVLKNSQTEEENDFSLLDLLDYILSKGQLAELLDLMLNYIKDVPRIRKLAAVTNLHSTSDMNEIIQKVGSGNPMVTSNFLLWQATQQFQNDLNSLMKEVNDKLKGDQK